MDYKKMEGNSTGYIGMANVSPPCGVSSTSPTVVVESSAVSTSILVHQNMKRWPIVMACPFCKITIKTKVQNRKVKPWYCCFCCCGCKKKELIHSCGNCGEYLGTYGN